ncbi:UDP-2,3-diacylglucosamine diphosphatase [Aquirufa rosea]|uniref:UDP-2,3-diacylglucosamine diphosphatase n=1 Tax=Aquirufa rosea TaxID=2509241 RepID=A0A4Q1BYB5_9BACT|nr:UDP-2,3-diacylglucosamine diphosphatase [Aquirufa rosea]RXK47683.1 UDP-2,3-diacylglucosamine diphosphatase [Aquirufa rosea]
MKQLHVAKGKKVYFASDFHLGFPNETESREREAALLDWLQNAQQDAQAIFLLGDLFDFWFEYKKAVPKGFVRFLGKLAELTDAGIELHIFVGNHDLWMYDYFQEELCAKIYREPERFILSFEEGQQKSIWVGHGDGLGPGDYGYKALKKVFTNSLAQFLFRWLHPDLGIRLAHAWSNTRKSNAITQGLVPFNPETDYILQYVHEKYHQDLASQEVSCCYVFGHRHHPIAYELGKEVFYYNLGDWFSPALANAYILRIDEHENTFQKYTAG